MSHPNHLSPSRGRPAASDVRAALLDRDPPLDLLVEGLLGVEAATDWACRCPRGGVTLVQWAGPGEDLAALTHLLAQLAWLEPRLPDWQQLAPERNLDPERAPAGLLLAHAFTDRTRLAAASLGGAIQLGRWTPTGIEAGGPPPANPEREPPVVLDLESAPGEWASQFRTRLRHEDL